MDCRKEKWNFYNVVVAVIYCIVLAAALGYAITFGITYNSEESYISAMVVDAIVFIVTIVASLSGMCFAGRFILNIFIGWGIMFIGIMFYFLGLHHPIVIGNNIKLAWGLFSIFGVLFPWIVICKEEFYTSE
jgi:hypothetical protein